MPQPPPEPGAADWRRAHRLGFRPRTVGIDLGLRFAVVAVVVVAISRPALVERTRAWLVGVSQAELTDVEPLVMQGVALLAASLMVALALSLVSAVLLRRFGPRVRDAGTRGIEPARGASLGARWALFSISLLLAGFALRGVLAGGARAVTASESGLLAFWAAWAQRVPAILAAILVAVGVLEGLDARRRTREAYLRYREQGHRHSGGQA